MLDFIARYWMEFALGLIASGLGVLAKAFWSLYKKEKQHQQEDNAARITKEIDTKFSQLLEQSKEDDQKIQDALAELTKKTDILHDGLLFIYKQDFIHLCDRLLAQAEPITEYDMESLTKEFNLYTEMGGNGYGKTRYEHVQIKYEAQITK